jgi:hypothetical protein
VPASRVGIRRESRLLRLVLSTYRVDIPPRSEACKKCLRPFRLPDELSGYVIHLNDAHLASKHVIAEALEELGL